MSKNKKVRKRGFEIISIEQWAKDVFNANFSNLKNSEDKNDRMLLEEIESSYNAIKPPESKTSHSAGYDFLSYKDFSLNPTEEILLPTGIKSYMMEGEVLLIFSRSGLGFKYYARLANGTGVVDKDYYNNSNNEGHIWIKIRNEGNLPMHVSVNDGVAQGVFLNYLKADNGNIDSERIGGFGSTGHK